MAKALADAQLYPSWLMPQQVDLEQAFLAITADEGDGVMSIPALERRPTHQAVPLLRSEISRLTHRRLARVLALILLGGIVVISVLVFFVHSKQRLERPELPAEDAGRAAQGYWQECVAGRPRRERAERLLRARAGRPVTQIVRLRRGRPVQGLRSLPVAIIGVAIAAAGVAFIMGASAGGAEWSSRSMTLQLLFEPRRLRLLVIKWLGLVHLSTVACRQSRC